MNLSFEGDVSSTFNVSLPSSESPGKRRTGGAPSSSNNRHKRPRTHSEPPRRGGLFGQHLTLAGLSLAGNTNTSILTNDSIALLDGSMTDSSRLSTSTYDGPRQVDTQHHMNHLRHSNMTDDSGSTLDEFSERLRDVSSRQSSNNSFLWDLSPANGSTRRALPPRGHSNNSTTSTMSLPSHLGHGFHSSSGTNSRPMLPRIRRGEHPDRL